MLFKVVFLRAPHNLLGFGCLLRKIALLQQLCYFGAVEAADHAVPSLRECGQFLSNFGGCTFGIVCRSRGIAIKQLVRHVGH